MGEKYHYLDFSKLFTSVIPTLECEGVKMMKRLGNGKMEEKTCKCAEFTEFCQRICNRCEMIRTRSDIISHNRAKGIEIKIKRSVHGILPDVFGFILTAGCNFYLFSEEFPL